ncbi:MAG TPA: SHOCT domain-containing protein [Candidatus Paceibacterota bacterium]|nr:SHOCT domain-containing protein [Candidatus Paceibacterota bacterium]
MMYAYGYGPYYGGFHFIGAIFWILVILAIVAAIRRRRANGGRWSWGMPWPDKGMEILKERYAKGEITKEEYEERKKVLMG